MLSAGSLLLLQLLTPWSALTPLSTRDRPKFCYLPADPGRCLAYMPSFYYDSASKKCKKFIYGGCRGNTNNFKTWDECRHTCVASAVQPRITSN
nr:Kunitz-type peptide [Vipera transcaucasiana]